LKARLALLLWLSLALCSCDAASRDPGAKNLFIIPGAQFVPGAMPGDQGGPKVTGIANDHTFIRPGTVGERVQGAAEATATGVGLGLPGDKGYWVVTTQVPDISSPGMPSFEVRASYSANFPPGPFQIAIQAVDAQGRSGPPSMLALEAQINPPPDGDLVFSLSWSHNADLDLHVVTPDGIEVWRGNVNSLPPPPGTPPDPNAPLRGGIFQGDSNGACVIDGRRQENVVWSSPAPTGHYTVRVDTFDMCGQAYAYWDVQVLQRGSLLGRARGESLPTDTRQPHGAGGGVTALEIDVP
jgi:hypothetical protein